MTKALKRAQRDVLVRLSSENRLTPDEVIREARSQKSPLHSCFQWNVEKAAMIAWRQQARDLIASFTITVVREEREYHVREFVEMPNKPLGTQGYAAFEDVKSNPKMARRFMDDQIRTAVSYVEIAKEYAGALGLSERVAEAIEKLKELREIIHNSTAA